MANPFETFIQLELPKRPYLASDVSTESIIVRRGPGPKQLDGVQLTDGQFLGKENGSIVGLNPSSSGYTHTQSVSSTSWVIQHNKNNSKAIVMVLDNNDKQIIPDSLLIEANTVTVDFYQATTGSVNILFIE